MATYQNLRAAGVTTRAAAALTGLSRATAGRKPATPLRATRVVPANRLSPAAVSYTHLRAHETGRPETGHPGAGDPGGAGEQAQQR